MLSLKTMEKREKRPQNLGSKQQHQYKNSKNNPLSDIKQVIGHYVPTRQTTTMLHITRAFFATPAKTQHLGSLAHTNQPIAANPLAAILSARRPRILLLRTIYGV